MVLEISKTKNHFRIIGKLDRRTLPIFENTFQNIFDELDDVIISIEKLNGIDRQGVNAIAKLHNESLAKDKKLSIIGLGCKELYQHLNDTDAA